MTPEEAIEILEHHTKLAGVKMPLDVYNAAMLGIEAMKAYLKSQAAGWYPPGYKLPGETK